MIKRYNSIIRGFINYYSFADNRPRLCKIHLILKTSLRKTLSRKLKLNRRRFEESFGDKITISRREVAKGTN